MKKAVFLALVAAGVAMTSCKKEKEGNLDIHVHSPEENAAYTSPVDVDVHVEGGELIIHDIEVKIFRKSDPNDVVFDYDNHVEVKEFEVIDQFSVGGLSAPTLFTIQVNVGEDEHTASLSHDFTINP